MEAVQFIPPDNSWRGLWRYVSPKQCYGAIIMVKWRSWGIGIEWLSFKWLAIFVGPFCFAFGRVLKAPLP